MPQAAPTLARSLRSAFHPKALLATLGLALILWILLGPMLLRREFRTSFRAQTDLSSHKLEWTKQGDPLAHGVWLPEGRIEPTFLEIRPSGTATKDGKRFEFWLYEVKDQAGNQIDLRQIVADADPEMVQPGWTTFEGVPGIVYTGQSPGLIRIPIDTREATINHARTDMGGPIEFRFRGQTQTIDVSDDSTKGVALTLPNGPIGTDTLLISQQLPTYRPASLRLSWNGPVGARVWLDSPVIQFWFLGTHVATRAVDAVAADKDTQPDNTTSPDAQPRFTTTGPAPSLSIAADYSAGKRLYLLGWATIFASLVALRLLWVFGRSALAWLRASPSRLALPVALALIALNLSIATIMPVWVTSDGMDYIDGAAGIAFDGSLDRAPLYKAPGLTFVLAACMRITPDFLQVFAYAQAVFSLATAALAFVFLRKRTSIAWALVAALVVGAHPILIAYQSYLLRENLGSTLFLAVAVGLVVLARPSVASSVRRTWATVIAIALTCGFGAYVRENFQNLFIIVPIAVFFLTRGPLPRRAAFAAAMLGIAFLTLTPYLAVKCWPNKVMGVVSGKTHANRALNVWKNEVTDGNDTAFLSHEEWLAFQKQAEAGQIGDYDYVGAFKNGIPLKGRLKDRTILKNRNTGLMERIMKQIADESVARDPLSHARSIALSFANQLGLWNFYWPSDASAGLWYATPYRGKSWGYATNYMIGTDWMHTDELYIANAEQLEPLVARTARDCTGLKVTLWTRLFNEYMWAVQFLRPVVAVLFLLGLYRAFRQGDRAIVAVGCITLFMMGAAALVVAPATDRFAAPFIPVVTCVALHTLATWRRGSTPAVAPAPKA